VSAPALENRTLDPVQGLQHRQERGGAGSRQYQSASPGIVPSLVPT
jgi:hypothetical protein